MNYKTKKEFSEALFKLDEELYGVGVLNPALGKFLDGLFEDHRKLLGTLESLSAMVALNSKVAHPDSLISRYGQGGGITPASTEEFTRQQREEASEQRPEVDVAKIDPKTVVRFPFNPRFPWMGPAPKSGSGQAQSPNDYLFFD